VQDTHIKLGSPLECYRDAAVQWLPVSPKMRPLSRLPVSSDVGDVSADVRRLFDELARQRPDRRHQITGECLPLLDVFETQDALDLVLDVPGVAVANLRIVVKGGVVIVAGEKDRPEPRPQAPASFHLVERDFGRFARAVRVHVAVDAARATATLRDGELRIVLPKIPERRARPIPVAISTEPPA
jgi:HSP20 family protein